MTTSDTTQRGTTAADDPTLPLERATRAPAREALSSAAAACQETLRQADVECYVDALLAGWPVRLRAQRSRPVPAR